MKETKASVMNAHVMNVMNVMFGAAACLVVGCGGDDDGAAAPDAGAVDSGSADGASDAPLDGPETSTKRTMIPAKLLPVSPYGLVLDPWFMPGLGGAGHVLTVDAVTFGAVPTLQRTIPLSPAGVGQPVEWILDPLTDASREIVTGMTFVGGKGLAARIWITACQRDGKPAPFPDGVTTQIYVDGFHDADVTTLDLARSPTTSSIDGRTWVLFEGSFDAVGGGVLAVKTPKTAALSFYLAPPEIVPVTLAPASFAKIPKAKPRVVEEADARFVGAVKALPPPSPVPHTYPSKDL